MAVEDIPPRRVRGLGTRLGEIIENAPYYRPSAAEALYGGTSAATEKDIEESLSSVIEPPETLPLPEYISDIPQADKIGLAVPTSRPDRYKKYGYYGQGPKKSTRVHAMQWIPTMVTKRLMIAEQEDELSGQAALYKGFQLEAPALFGDILIAFARPSNVQAHSLYVYEHQAESVWRALEATTSLGTWVNRLSNGRPYTTTDGDRYKKIHKNTMDDGYPYDYWIFNEMDRWSTIRPDNSRL